MSKFLPKSLPKENPHFNLDNIEGNVSKHVYSGNFVCKIANTRTQIQIASYKAHLAGPYGDTLDQITLNLFHMVAYCKYTLVECPEWFKDTDYGLDLYDQNIIKEVFDRIIEKEEEWLAQVWGKKEEPKTEGANE